MRVAALAVAALGGALVSAPPAAAHGWHRHHHHHHVRARHALRVHSYEPPLAQVSLLPAWGCGLQKVITRYGTLAYRQVCY